MESIHYSMIFTSKDTIAYICFTVRAGIPNIRRFVFTIWNPDYLVRILNDPALRWSADFYKVRIQMFLDFEWSDFRSQLYIVVWFRSPLFGAFRSFVFSMLPSLRSCFTFPGRQDSLISSSCSSLVSWFSPSSSAAFFVASAGESRDKKGRETDFRYFFKRSGGVVSVILKIVFYDYLAGHTHPILCDHLCLVHGILSPQGIALLCAPKSSLSSLLFSSSVQKP